MKNIKCKIRSKTYKKRNQNIKQTGAAPFKPSSLLRARLFFSPACLLKKMLNTYIPLGQDV